MAQFRDPEGNVIGLHGGIELVHGFIAVPGAGRRVDR
jgi:hypothetical protein